MTINSYYLKTLIAVALILAPLIAYMKIFVKFLFRLIICFSAIMFSTETLTAANGLIKQADTTKKSDSKKQEPVKGIEKPKEKLEQPLKTEILNFRIKTIGSSRQIKNMIRCDYLVEILISNPKDFVLQRPSDTSELILYADGLPLKGMNTDYLRGISKAAVSDPLRIWADTLWIPFIFKRDATNKEAWNYIFHLAKWNRNFINFDLSLGWAGMYPIEKAAATKANTKVTLEFYKGGVFWILLAAYIMFILLFVRLANSTGLIREPDLNNQGPFSLSQTQLAFWTVIVLGGFIYLILLTGLTDSMNDSILILIGISGGTTGVANFIDYYKTPPAVARTHRSFLLDILSDGTNVSVQRTQTAMWNLVLGIYFLWYVITYKSMPVFSGTILVLAGVSNILYLGGKGAQKS